MTSRPLQRALGLAGLAAALLLPEEAHVSQVHYMDEPLAMVLDQTALVFVGTLADPPHRSAELRFPITRADGTKGESSYGVMLQRVKVSEVLHPPGAPVPKDIIEVYSPDMVSGLSTQLAYDVEGISESPIYFQLEGGIYPEAPEHAAGAIYLLGQPQAYATPRDQGEAFAALFKAIAGAYPLVMGNSVLPLDQREALLKALAEVGRAAQPEPG
ncbi:MAG: hypothetical protein H6741_20165 [Alphaproteobacteria bacterium]|nr:hypothetical protein [Alphaproteobacteria bacterium]